MPRISKDSIIDSAHTQPYSFLQSYKEGVTKPLLSANSYTIRLVHKIKSRAFKTAHHYEDLFHIIYGWLIYAAECILHKSISTSQPRLKLQG